jgi:hypothetical protein
VRTTHFWNNLHRVRPKSKDDTTGDLQFTIRGIDPFVVLRINLISREIPLFPAFLPTLMLIRPRPNLICMMIFFNPVLNTTLFDQVVSDLRHVVSFFSACMIKIAYEKSLMDTNITILALQKKINTKLMNSVNVQIYKIDIGKLIFVKKIY